jgi:hypothetical protein
MNRTYSRYLVWTNYGEYEGWKCKGAEEWAEAVTLRDEEMLMSPRDVIITEYVPLEIRDGRTAKS